MANEPDFDDFLAGLTKKSGGSVPVQGEILNPPSETSWEDLVSEKYKARPSGADPEAPGDGVRQELAVLAEDSLAEMTRLAMKTTREILTINVELVEEKEKLGIWKLKQAAAADVYRTATRVDETLMRRQEQSILPKLWARLQEEKQKRLG